MKFIPSAFAAPAVPPVPGAPVPAPGVPVPAAPADAFMMNLLMVVVLVILFYVLLIMPQQKRFKKHAEAIKALKKGDRVLLMSGFIGRIDKMVDSDNEVVIDLGNNMKVTVVRSAIQGKADEASA